jgi:NAD(P)-dependent dehydrogenase (short-subunit alcohol dehydrogenase family)
MDSKDRFSNKVVMITGAAGSLGRVTAEAFAAAGASLILVDVQEAALQAAYPQADARSVLAAANLLDTAATARAVDAAHAKLGRIDALCNIAGGFRMGPAVHETDAALWSGMMDLNVGTLLNAVRAVVPKMLAGGGGKIVNIGSVSALKGPAAMGAYAAAKGAVVRLTESMSAELREKNVNVNCVLPSVLDTPPNRAAMPDADPSRWVAPQDLAQVLLFLCSDAARAIHGAAIPVTHLS